MISRGIRNNNPGNIRIGATQWQGMAIEQNDPSFIQFSTPEFGIRAIAKIMLTYESMGVNTIEAAIHRWAPPVENDTDAYVQAVCDGCSVGATTVVDLRALMPNLVKAIILHENGSQPYTDDQINAGIALAEGHI